MLPFFHHFYPVLFPRLDRTQDSLQVVAAVRRTGVVRVPEQIVESISIHLAADNQVQVSRLRRFLPYQARDFGGLVARLRENLANLAGPITDDPLTPLL